MGQMAIAIALPGFNDLVCSVTPIFLLMVYFLYRFSTFCEKMKKIYRLEAWFFWQNVACVAGVRSNGKGERRAREAWEDRTREERVLPPALILTSLPFYGLPRRLGKIHHPLFLGFHLSVRRFQMPLEELSFEKTLATFEIIYATDPLFQNMAEIVCLRWLAFDNFSYIPL